MHFIILQYCHFIICNVCYFKNSSILKFSFYIHAMDKFITLTTRDINDCKYDNDSVTVIP